MDYLDDQGRLSYTTESGAQILGGPLSNEEGVWFEITNGDETFGFELGYEHFAEWAEDETGRDVIRIRYPEDGGPTQYTINGKTRRYDPSDIPAWSLAKARTMTTVEIPTGLPVEKMRTHNNELGEELAETLEVLGRPLVDENGECTGRFMAVLAACLRFKCPLGGLANAACVACTGTFLACVAVAIMAIGGAV